MDIIRKLRMLIGMTQKEFGEVIGVKQQTVCKYERADSNVSLKVLQKISDKFAISVEELIEGNLEKYMDSGHRRNISSEIENNIMNRIRKLNGNKLKKLLNFLVKLDSDI